MRQHGLKVTPLAEATYAEKDEQSQKTDSSIELTNYRELTEGENGEKNTLETGGDS